MTTNAQVPAWGYKEVRARAITVASKLGVESLEVAFERLRAGNHTCGPGWSELHELWAEMKRLKADEDVPARRHGLLAAFWGRCVAR